MVTAAELCADYYLLTRRTWQVCFGSCAHMNIGHRATMRVSSLISTSAGVCGMTEHLDAAVQCCPGR